jgi:glycosyltransferase involved in cell wall biosynthesis
MTIASPLRVLFCRSNPIAPDPRVEKEAQSLIRAGYQVQILGWDRSGDLPSPQETVWGTIHRLGIRAGYARGVLNFIPLLRWQAGLMLWLMRHADEFDLLHACDFDTILPALVCKRLKHKKVVYDIFDFYADHLRNTPEILKRLIRKTDLWAIGRADGVILVDDCRIEQISGADPRRLAVIYNSPLDSSPGLLKSGQSTESEPIHIAYIGLLQIERGLIELLEVIARHPAWKLDLAGFGGDQEAILAKASQLENVTWHGRVLYDKALQLSAQANVLVALYDPAIPNHRYASPNKVFEGMMLGKPVVVARRTNMDQIIENAGAGLVVEYGDIDGLEAALLKLEQNPGLRKELSSSARKAYEEIYSWSMMERRLLDLYLAVTEGREVMFPGSPHPPKSS